MNATLVLMTAAFSAGGGQAGCAGCAASASAYSAPVAYAAPASYSAAAGCDSCGSSSAGLFGRLKGLSPFGGMGSGCKSCGSSLAMFGKLKGRLGHGCHGCHSASYATPAPCGEPCGQIGHTPVEGGYAGPSMPASAPMYGTPQAMPSASMPQAMPQMETPKEMPKTADPKPLGNPGGTPKINQSVLPQVAAPPVGGATAPY